VRGNGTPVVVWNIVDFKGIRYWMLDRGVYQFCVIKHQATSIQDHFLSAADHLRATV